MREIDFAALLCSRLCHDLVSPVGALSNGMEILREEQDKAMREEVMALLDRSIAQTAARLQFFRLAFGAAGGLGGDLDARDVCRTLSALMDGGKVTLDWQLDRSAMDKTLVKLVLNLALMLSEALLRGGTLEIAEDANGLHLTARGDRFLLSDDAIAALDGGLPEDRLEPRTAPAFLAGQVAAGLGARLVYGAVSPETHRVTVALSGA